MVSVVSCGGKKVDPLVVDRHMAVDTEVRDIAGPVFTQILQGQRPSVLPALIPRLMRLRPDISSRSWLCHVCCRAMSLHVIPCSGEVSVVADAFEDDEPLLKEYLSRCKQVRYNIVGLNDSAIVHGYRAYDASIKAGNYVYAVKICRR